MNNNGSLNSAPNVPQLSGAAPSAGFMDSVGKLGSSLLGGIGGLAGMPGLSLSDQSVVAPTVTTNQSGGTNNIQSSTARDLLPWFGKSSAGMPVWPLVVIVGLVVLAVWFATRRK